MIYPMFKAINGFTKAKILTVIREQFTAKSVNGDGECVYRGPNGARCAVGLFIPDSEYNAGMDIASSMSSNGTDIETVLAHYPSVAAFLPLELEALQKLQSVHDGATSYNGMFKDTRDSETVKNQLIQWVEANVQN